MSVKVFDKRHILTLDGGPICVYESGNVSRPPVLLLHGAMYDESRFIWYHLAPFLAETHHVFALDFPRHGGSRPWRGFVDRETIYRVLDAVLDHFQLPPMPFIGLSMGGGVTIGYALKNPGRVTGAVLLGPGGLGRKLNNHFLTWVTIKMPGFLKGLTRYYGKLPPDKMRWTLAKLLHDGDKSAGFEELSSILTQEAQGKYEAGERSMDDWQLESIAPFQLTLDFLPELQRLNVPTLYLRAENDQLVSQSVMDAAARLTPNAALAVIKNCGHVLPVEQPGEVNQAIADFLVKNNL